MDQCLQLATQGDGTSADGVIEDQVIFHKFPEKSPVAERKTGEIVHR